MATGVPIGRKSGKRPARATPRWALLGLALSSASCVPVTASGPSIGIAAGPTFAVPSLSAPAGLPSLPAQPAAAAVPPAATALAFRGRTAIDDLRSLDCLAQAIYYEAASESEEGQRAVAQVVLNRVRHPAWPNSVCGVVYQGPMRAGGGCQFTFTCDGSLARSPSADGWTRARRLAAEALAGRVFEGVGLSTHYHTHAVSPSWAPRLERTAMIGAHRFYRLPGPAGSPRAFVAAYSGSEPIPRATSLFRRASPAGPTAPSPTADAAFIALSALPAAPSAETMTTPAELPPSTIREEYRQSGQWRDDAPASITRR